MRIDRRLALGASLVFLAACACAPKYGTAGTSGQAPENVPVDAAVRIVGDGSGGYVFKYSAPYADADGNFDFTSDKLDGKSVALTFRIEGGSVPGIRFKEGGRDAMWIADKRRVGEGSPKGPYDGGQFTDFSVSPDGQTLSVIDLNDDGMVYRYALRFDVNGQTVQHDPDVKNGDGGGH